MFIAFVSQHRRTQWNMPEVNSVPNDKKQVAKYKCAQSLWEEGETASFLSSNREETKEGNFLTKACFRVIINLCKNNVFYVLRASSFNLYITRKAVLKINHLQGEDGVVSCVTNAEFFSVGALICTIMASFKIVSRSESVHPLVCVWLLQTLMWEASCTRVKRISNLCGYPISRSRIQQKGRANTIHRVRQRLKTSL